MESRNAALPVETVRAKMIRQCFPADSTLHRVTQRLADQRHDIRTES